MSAAGTRHEQQQPGAAGGGGGGGEEEMHGRPFQIIVAASSALRGIGVGGKMPWRLPSELEYFKRATTAVSAPSAAPASARDDKENADAAGAAAKAHRPPQRRVNAVIMGRKTWNSLPNSVRPLPGRLNVVLSRDGGSAMKPARAAADGGGDGLRVVCAGFEEALAVLSAPPYAESVDRVFVIGGSQVYAEALRHPSCGAVHLTEVDYPGDAELDTFFPAVEPERFGLYASGPIEREAGLRFQRLTYTARGLSGAGIASMLPAAAPAHEERQYLDAIRDILDTGAERGDRTGTGTISKFGIQMRFDLRRSFPLLTTKRVFWRGVAEELLWFISGSTDARALQEKGIHIWDGNASREYLDSIGLTEREEGDLGPVYGFQWRHFGAEYSGRDADYAGKGVDQLRELIHKIRTSPNDRRLVLTAWNPTDIPIMALPPCHMFCQFYVAHGELSCQLYQRSGDMGLGVPFNIASYALLTRLVAHVCGLRAGELSHVIGDAHVYSNHVEPLREQLRRDPRPFPTLEIRTDTDDIDKIVFGDLKIDNYTPDKKIEMKMAV